MNDEKPFFSIIVPTHNRPAQLVDVCLTALTRLDYPRDLYEVIVVNDGGQCFTELTKSFRKHLNLKLLSQPHAGPAVARNYGAREAKGEFLAFTDDDCAPARDWLESLAGAFAETPESAVGGRTVNLLSENLYSTASQMLIDYLYDHYNQTNGRVHFLASNNLAVPAQIFHTVGGFNETFSLGGEDREFCSRWISKGYQMAYASNVLVLHSHRLKLPSFIRQHFTYGRGAFRYRLAVSRSNNEPVRFEKLRFYWELLFYPLSKRLGFNSLPLWSLFILSQAANCAGLFWEKAHRSQRTRVLRRKTK